MKKFKITFEIMANYPISLNVYVYGFKVTKSENQNDSIILDNNFVTFPSYITSIEEVNEPENKFNIEFIDSWEI